MCAQGTAAAAALMPASAATSSAGGRGKPGGEKNCGLDWELPCASAPGSTEPLSLVSEGLLSTQPVCLRVCDLRSCGAVEHVRDSFLQCPRCQQVAYCSSAHRSLAWRAWHQRVCSVTRKKEMKPGQTLRYPVRQLQRLHSGVPVGLKASLASAEMQHYPAVTRIA